MVTNEAVEINRCFQAVKALECLLSENEMEIISCALHCYGRHPEDHSYNEEIDDIRKIAYAIDQCGYNCLSPEFDILKR